MKLTGTLTLKVVYEDKNCYAGKIRGELQRSINRGDIKRLLRDVVNRAAGEGLLSGESKLEVETWEAEVEVT